MLRQLDQKIEGDGFEGDQYKRLRTGIVALLSQNGDGQSMQYLRSAWLRSPDRRQAMVGLARQPAGENWDYLIRSLPNLESFATGEVMNALRTVDLAADDPEAFRREVILHGLRMEQEGSNSQPAIKLLEHWTGNEFPPSSDKNVSSMAAWQKWFATTFSRSIGSGLTQRTVRFALESGDVG